MRTDFVLNALEQALYARQPERDDALVCHSDRGSRYVGIRYTERLAEAGIELSMGSRGDPYYNALAETINPVALRVFLTAATVVDDIGAILVIAVFYSTDLQLVYLAAAGVTTGALALLNRAHVYRLSPYILLGVVLWVCIHAAGLHATLAGRWLRSCADDPKRASAKVGRCFRRLQAYGLIAKIPRARRWRVTAYGHRAMGTSLYLREHYFPNVYATAATV